jgi:hypothetical protein
MKNRFAVGTTLLIALLICAASVAQAQSVYLPGATGNYYGDYYGNYDQWGGQGYWGGPSYAYRGYILRPYHVGVRGFLVTPNGLAPMGILDTSPIFGWGYDDYNSNDSGFPADSSGLPTIDQAVITGDGVQVVDTPRSTTVLEPAPAETDQPTQVVYDPDTLTVASGTVVSLDIGRPGDLDADNVWAIVETQSGTRINVSLAPDTYLKVQALVLSPGDHVTVLGSLVYAGDYTVIVAREIRSSGSLLRLRNEAGSAAWVKQ